FAGGQPSPGALVAPNAAESVESCGKKKNKQNKKTQFNRDILTCFFLGNEELIVDPYSAIPTSTWEEEQIN
uniref:Uncharacterized protein n=1 Tax=Athene cunicularia TaxID=194338 RepID=A0A663M800_ATHCN